MDCSLPGSSVHGISQARILGWVAICFCGDLLDLGLETASLAWEGRFFTTEPPGKPIFLFINSVQLCSCVRLFATPWTAVRQASLSITNFQTLLKLMSTESVMSSNHLILCCPLLLLPSIFPDIRVFPNESVLLIKWPKYWSFSISPSNGYLGLISFRMDWLDLLAVQGISRVFSNNTIQKHQFFCAQPFLYSNSYIHT